MRQQRPCFTIHAPSSASRSTSNENPEEEVVVAPPKALPRPVFEADDVVVDDPDVLLVVVDLEVVDSDPDVVDAEVE